jgi:CheY-like chemotaxis protein
MSDGPRATVLLVEDEVFIRLVTAEDLTDAGFEVLEAADAEAALRVLEQSPEVSAMFTDINMPGDIDGLSLAKLVHERWPRIGVLVTSGKVRPTSAELPDDGRFVAKPYRSRQVIAELSAMLEARR